MQETKKDTIREQVRARYGEIGREKEASCCCSGSGSSCCGSVNSAEDVSREMGYTAEELETAPEGANLGLGCGNPQAIAALKAGETVLDLGSGGGFDAFLAAERVGSSGKVIGVDMTPEMISRARKNAEKGNYANVDFRLGEIENLPVEDGQVDVIMSNCVINLSPDKQRVFDEAFRVLKPGGRLAISDVVALAEMPQAVKQDYDLYSGCISGAAPIEELRQMLKRSGFFDIRIEIKEESREMIDSWTPGFAASQFIASALIQAEKPLQ
jgi:SAM-dependent methyltransferase